MHRAHHRADRPVSRVYRTKLAALLGVTGLTLLASGCQRPISPVIKPPRPEPSVVSGRTVIIDAGHGGRDSGAPGVGPFAEKHVNLAIAMRVAWILQRRGVRVVTTRRDDTFVPLDERASMADRSGADLLVSIHADAAPNPRATGATVYIANGAQPASETAADRIDESLSAAGIKVRGVRSAKFRVLVGHARPSVLVECGYLTNAVEASLLASEDYQARVASAIAAGVLDHFGALR